MQFVKARKKHLKGGKSYMEWTRTKDAKPKHEGIYITTTVVGSVQVQVIVKLTRFRITPAYSEFSDSDWHKSTHWMPYKKGQNIEDIEPAKVNLVQDTI